MFKITKTNPEVFHNETFGNFYRSIPKKLNETEEEFSKRFNNLKEKCNKKFRVCDDDGTWYFKGVSTTDDDEKAFEPLDMVGVDYGCTYIEYWNKVKNRWEEL
jgi:hypothetical protein